MKNVQLTIQNVENVINVTTGLAYAGGMRGKKRPDIMIPQQKNDTRQKTLRGDTIKIFVRYRL